MEVKTVSNITIDKKLTRKIKNSENEYGYYKIGDIYQKNSGDCYSINNIFYTIQKGRIVWDEQLNQYVLKTSTFEGIININLERGFFSKELSKTVIVYLNKEPISDLCISAQVAENLNLIEGENNTYYNPQYYSYEQILPRRIIDKNYKNSLPYNFKYWMKECSDSFLKFKIVENKNTEHTYSQLSSMLSKYTFGVELETTKGMIPTHLYENLGVRPVRDGSINGLEYVTIPLTGKKGLYVFIEIIKLINKYTSSDYSCSMHIHVGNIPRTMEFIVSMFKTIYHLQDEIYRMFPLYKRYNDGIKRQCYTAPFCSYLMSSLNNKYNTVEDVEVDYQKIVYDLSGKHDDYYNFKSLEGIENHPYDVSDNSKWNVKSRYKIVNLIPLIFTNKQTVEYRIFTVPDTVDKAINFLTIALSITDYVCKYQDTILQKNSTSPVINLRKIFKNTLNSSDKQLDLLEKRKYLVNNHISQKGGFFEEKDIKLINNERNDKYRFENMVPPIVDISELTLRFDSARPTSISYPTP